MREIGGMKEWKQKERTGRKQRRTEKKRDHRREIEEKTKVNNEQQWKTKGDALDFFGGSFKNSIFWQPLLSWLEKERTNTKGLTEGDYTENTKRSQEGTETKEQEGRTPGNKKKRSKRKKNKSRGKPPNHCCYCLWCFHNQVSKLLFPRFSF